MPAVARMGDSAIILHHTCTFPPITSAATGSLNVFINGLPCHRVGDVNFPHTFGPLSCIIHIAPLITGSSSVFINGLPVGRVSSIHACPTMMILGSSNVFAGG